MLPFRLTIPAPVRPPCPSKVSRLTPANGPANAGGAVMNPMSLSAKVPSRVALEHAFPAAFAMGAKPRVSAATAPIAKVFAIVLRFMIISFRKEIVSASLFPFRRYRRQWIPKIGHGLIYFLKPTRRGAIHRRTLRGNHESVEGLGRR